jgi:hypothetical protein
MAPKCWNCGNDISVERKRLPEGRFKGLYFAACSVCGFAVDAPPAFAFVDGMSATDGPTGRDRAIAGIEMFLVEMYSQLYVAGNKYPRTRHEKLVASVEVKG